MTKILWVIAILAGLAAIAVMNGQPDRLVRGQIQTVLVRTGVSDDRADCMARRMVERLTYGQIAALWRMQAPQLETQTPGDLREFLTRIRQVDDPEIVSVTVSSAGLCALGLA